MRVISGIYCIENTINHKRYIGQSKNIYSRWYAHKTKLRHQRHSSELMQNDWDAYGEDRFSFYIIEIIEDAELRDKAEIYYIDLYKTTNKNYGYNKETGGIVRSFVSEESRRKISENHADVSGNKNPFYGKKHSKESINKFLTNTNYINSRPRGEKSHTNKISKEIAMKIKQYFSVPENNKYGAIKHIAEKYNVSTNIVAHIKNGHAWTWL